MKIRYDNPEEYEGTLPLGYVNTCGEPVYIYDVKYGIEDSLILGRPGEPLYEYEIEYTEDGMSIPGLYLYVDNMLRYNTGWTGKPPEESRYRKPSHNLIDDNRITHTAQQPNVVKPQKVIEIVMEDELEMEESVYERHGYRHRQDYLEQLAYDFDCDVETVMMLAHMLGPSEDFDGLINALEDYDGMRY